jgi:hypothetical protein
VVSTWQEFEVLHALLRPHGCRVATGIKTALPLPVSIRKTRRAISDSLQVLATGFVESLHWDGIDGATRRAGEARLKVSDRSVKPIAIGRGSRASHGTARLRCTTNSLGA